MNLVFKSLAFFTVLGFALSIWSELYNKCTDSYTYSIVQTSPNLPAFKTKDAYVHKEDDLPALVRLHKDDDIKDRFICSAFIVSNEYAITAAHCLVNERKVMVKSDFFIHPLNKGLEDKITAKAVTVNISSDLGLLWGNFTRFAKLRIDTNPGGFLMHEGPYRTCGFPYGDVNMCPEFYPSSNFYNFVTGRGFLYPGMSGGPVIALSDLTAIGVNSSTSGYGVNIAPLIGLFSNAEVEIQ